MVMAGSERPVVIGCDILQALEEKDRKQASLREQLTREHRQLKKRLDMLRSLDEYRNSRGERTISECSSSTMSTASTASSASPDEHGESMPHAPTHHAHHSTMGATSTPATCYIRSRQLEQLSPGYL